MYLFDTTHEPFGNDEFGLPFFPRFVRYWLDNQDTIIDGNKQAINQDNLPCENNLFKSNDDERKSERKKYDRRGRNEEHSSQWDGAH